MTCPNKSRQNHDLPLQTLTKPWPAFQGSTLKTTPAFAGNSGQVHSDAILHDLRFCGGGKIDSVAICMTCAFFRGSARQTDSVAMCITRASLVVVLGIQILFIFV